MMIQHNYTLPVLVDMLYLPTHIGVSRKYVAFLRFVAADFEVWAGEPVPINELTELLVCRYLAHTLRTRAPATVNQRRDAIVRLWRFAHRRKLVTDPPPADLCRAPVVREEPTAWSLAQVQRIVDAAFRRSGTIGNCRSGDWWGALILTAFYSALRIGSLREIRPSDVDLETGWLTIRGLSTKPKRFQTVHLPPVCINAIKRIHNSRRELLFFWPYTDKILYNGFVRILDSAGVPRSEGNQTLFHELRRTAVSFAAQVSLEDARRLAGHQDAALTNRYYVNQRIAQARVRDVLPTLDTPNEPKDRQLYLPGF